MIVSGMIVLRCIEDIILYNALRINGAFMPIRNFRQRPCFEIRSSRSRVWSTLSPKSLRKATVDLGLRI